MNRKQNINLNKVSPHIRQAVMEFNKNDKASCVTAIPITSTLLLNDNNNNDNNDNTIIYKYDDTKVIDLTVSPSNKLKRTRSGVIEYEQKVQDVVQKRQKIKRLSEDLILEESKAITRYDISAGWVSTHREKYLVEKLRVAYDYQEKQREMIADLKECLVLYDIANDDVQEQAVSSERECERLLLAVAEKARRNVKLVSKNEELMKQLDDSMIANGILNGKLCATEDALDKTTDDCDYYKQSAEEFSRLFTESNFAREDLMKELKPLRRYNVLYDDLFSALERCLIEHPQLFKSKWYQTYLKCFVDEIATQRHEDGICPCFKESSAPTLDLTCFSVDNENLAV